MHQLPCQLIDHSVVVGDGTAVMISAAAPVADDELLVQNELVQSLTKRLSVSVV
jgi:hypothetical protein